MAFSETCCGAIYYRILECEIKGYCNKIVLYNDSQSALKMADNYPTHKRFKHIDVRYNLIKDTISNYRVETKYLPTASMPSDLLTKGLSGIKHYKFIKTFGMVKK